MDGKRVDFGVWEVMRLNLVLLFIIELFWMSCLFFLGFNVLVRDIFFVSNKIFDFK